MKIAFINSVAGYGSTGKLVSMLAETEGVESRIYYGRKRAAMDVFSSSKPKPIEKSDRYFYFGSTLGFASHMISTFLYDKQGFCNTAETKRMVENLKEFQPDIVHLHNLHGYYLDVEPLFEYLKESGVKIIWTFHDCWPFTGHCAHYTSVYCDQWKERCTTCPALNHYPPTWNEKNVPVNYDKKKALFTSLEKKNVTIVTPSVWLREEVKQSFLGQYQAIDIPNGIDQTIFTRRESTVREKYQIGNRFLILAVAGQWYKEKGTEDIIAISKVMHKDSVLVVVGANGNFKKQLQRDNVITIERTENAIELAVLYSAADVLINPTQEDTFPTVNIEAQACGCPVITYQVGGSPEIIGENTGIVVEADNRKEMMKAIGRIRTKETVFKPEDCMAHAARYTREEMLKQYRKLYDSEMNSTEK